MSSYLHCPTCRCAYNLTAETSCPRCGLAASTPADPVAAVVAAAEQLARAVERATSAQLVQAQAELALRDAQRALPAPAALPRTSTSLLRAVRQALAPVPLPAPVPALRPGVQQALLTTLALALLARLPRPARALLARAV